MRPAHCFVFLWLILEFWRCILAGIFLGLLVWSSKFLCLWLVTVCGMNELQMFPEIVLSSSSSLKQKRLVNVLLFSRTMGYVSNCYVLRINGVVLCLSYSSIRTFRFPKERVLHNLRCEFPSKQLIVKIFG